MFAQACSGIKDIGRLCFIKLYIKVTFRQLLIGMRNASSTGDCIKMIILYGTRVLQK